MRILVIPSWYPPKGGRFFRTQAEELSKLGHQVDVLIVEERGISDTLNPKIDTNKISQIHEIRSIFHRIPKLNKLNISLFIRKYEKLISRYLKKNRPDVVKIDSLFWAAVGVSQVLKENNIPYIITEQKSILFGKKLPFNQKIIHKISSSLDAASAILANSSKMKSALRKFSQNTIEVIPNMVDTEFFGIEQIADTNREFTFITAGNLIPLKGYDILINAFAKLVSEEEKSLKLKIIGQGTEKDNLKNIINKLGLEKEIKLLGYLTQKELLKEYNLASVYVSSSNIETFGMTIIEAMSCGLPVVATKSGGPEDIINTQNGLLAEKANIESLYLNLKTMFHNFGTYNSQSIREEVIEKYGKKNVTKRIEIALQKSIEK